jgi:hypothetical protein
MTAVLKTLQGLKIKPETGSYLVQRADTLARAGMECDECIGNLR